MTLLIVVSLAVLVVLAALAVVIASRRSGKSADVHVAELVETLNSRIEELAQELEGAREQAEEELKRNRLLTDLGGSIDLDEVLARTLDAATHATGADAALVWLPTPDGPPTVATLGSRRR